MDKMGILGHQGPQVLQDFRDIKVEQLDHSACSLFHKSAAWRKDLHMDMDTEAIIKTCTTGEKPLKSKEQRTRYAMQ